MAVSINHVTAQNPVPASERGFWHLIALQFQGAFSDNLLKQIIILELVATIWTVESEQSQWNGVVAGVFVLPALLFSPWAGFLADKYSKRTITLVTKAAEIVVMLLAWLALLPADPRTAFPLSLAALFMLATQFTIFSPSKYGILPELVRPTRLSWANGIIEMTTFVAIILGSGLAPFLLTYFHGPTRWWLGVILIVLAVAGLAAGWNIDPTPPANPGRPFQVNFFPEFRRYITTIRRERILFLTVLGLAYFWGLGIMLLTHVNVWGQHSLHMLPTHAGYLFIVLSLGIGAGSVAAGYLSHDRIEFGLIPLGGIGLALFALPMAFASEALFWPMLICLFMLGFSAGLFSVPLNAILQQYTKIEDRGGILAATNFCTSAAMVASSIFYTLFNMVLKPGPNSVFLVTAGATIVATFIIVRLLPESLLRFVMLIFTSLIYRIRVSGREHLPKEGPALLVANHVSFIDALLIMAVSPRPVRFLVWEGLYRHRLLRLFLTTTRCIPVGSAQRPRELLASLRAASEALQSGELLCIFAEGQITRTGRMLPLRRGYEYILKNAPSPVIPIYLHGVWGSIFSFEGGKFFFKRPRSIPYRVNMVIGQPLPADTPPAGLRQRMIELGAEAALAAQPDQPVLHEALISASRRHWKQFYAIDVLSPQITHGQLLWRAMLLARRLRPVWGEQQTIGALLPPSVAGALVNYAAALSGRTIVNLNYTTGQSVMDACARQCELQTTVTARAFLEKINLTPPGTPVWIEEYRGFRGLGEIIGAMLLARLGTHRMIERYCGMRRRPQREDLATIIFSSGSTGTPKGVMLSHANIYSNVEQFRTGVAIWPRDRMLGTLPFFHSFGYTVALWGSALIGFGVVYHPNPLDAKTVGELIEKHRVSIIITTPTFLMQYMRRLAPEQLGGVNCLITGAEKLPDKLREAFRERFGIEPLQGYGTTECAPVVSTNIDDFRAPGFRQVGHKRGSIGHPLPGIAVQIRQPETGAPLPAGEAGLIWVRGPNVMRGYLIMPEKTAEVLQGGWYNTGDMGYIDEDGFIFITGRLSRFSKIGGEMVPHGAVEEKLHEVLGLSEPALVVTAVPDEAKGERLIVLHTLSDEQIAGASEKLAAAGLPNLWIPRRENYKRIEAIPVIGTGKLDLQAIGKLAQE